MYAHFLQVFNCLKKVGAMEDIIEDFKQGRLRWPRTEYEEAVEEMMTKNRLSSVAVWHLSGSSHIVNSKTKFCLESFSKIFSVIPTTNAFAFIVVVDIHKRNMYMHRRGSN